MGSSGGTGALQATTGSNRAPTKSRARILPGFDFDRNEREGEKGEREVTIMQ